MERDIWKWIFQEMDEEDFYHLVRLTEVKVKGFRTVERRMVGTLRSRIITEWLRPKVLLRVRELVGNEMKRDEVYGEMTKENLVPRMQEKGEAIVILTQLLQSHDKQKEALAEELFLLVDKVKKNVEQEKGVDLQAIIRSLEEKVRKQEDKIVQTAKKMAMMEQELYKKEREVKRYEAEQQELKKQMFAMKKRNEAYEEECSINKTKMIDLQNGRKRDQEELSRSQRVLEDKQREINRLHALGLTKPNAERKKSVIVVCDGQTNMVEQHVIASEKIDEAMQEGRFMNSDYICLLRFSMTPANIRKAKKVVPSERLKEFYTMHAFNEWEGSL